MSKKMSPAARIATGVGLALGGAALATGALYTEIMTSIIARRRTPHKNSPKPVASGCSHFIDSVPPRSWG